MSSKQPNSVALTIAVQMRPDVPADPPEWLCLECQEVLEIHQPDATNPNRLLGTCPHCGSWSCLDVEETGQETRWVQVRLPAPEELRRALSAGEETRSASSPRLVSKPRLGEYRSRSLGG